jgi:hypothetical protein
MGKTIFDQLPVLTPSRGLFASILLRVEEEKRRLARLRVAFFGFGAVASSLVLVPVLQYAGEGIARSGTAEYFSLFFSDSGMALLYWKEFLLSLVESLPIFMFALLCAVLLVFIWSLERVAVNARTAFLSVLA